MQLPQITDKLWILSSPLTLTPYKAYISYDFTILIIGINFKYFTINDYILLLSFLKDDSLDLKSELLSFILELNLMNFFYNLNFVFIKIEADSEGYQVFIKLK